MANEPPPSGLEHDYDAIAAAVMETVRGRWFLAEFAKRNRVVESDRIAGEIGRLERLVRERLPVNTDDGVGAEILAVMGVIETARRDIGALGAPSDGSAPETAFDEMLGQSEAATSTILDAAEHLQGATWALREQGVSPRACDALDTRITQIFAACEFQDIAAQRHRKLARALAVVEKRLGSLATQYGLPDTGSPSLRLASDASLSQADIDFVLVGPDPIPHIEQDETGRREAVRAGGESVPVSATDVPGQFRPRTLAEIDALPIQERIRLFT